MGSKKISGAFLAWHHEKLGKPAWMLEDTDFSAAETVPEIVSLRDHLTMIGNLARGPDPTYHIDYVLLGTPLYRGPLDLGLHTAPDIMAALRLLEQHAGYRPGHLQHILVTSRDWVTLELQATLDLGVGRSIVVETPLLVYYKRAARLANRELSRALVEFRHEAPPYLEKLQAAFGCEIRFGAQRDAISFHPDDCAIKSPAHVPDLWRTAIQRCNEEAAKNRSGLAASQSLAIVTEFMARQGRIPILAEVARAQGVSTRTMIRRLRADNLTFQGIVDSILQERSKALLADSTLTIAQVAAELGFTDTSGFYRRFQRWFGLTPDQLRRKLHLHGTTGG